MWESLANLVYDLTVRTAAGRGEGVWVGGWVSKADVFNLTGLSDDDLQSPYSPLQLWPPANIPSIIYTY